MEKLKVICHSCNSLSQSVDVCSSCEYDLSETKMLATTVLIAYNQAIELIKKKNIIESWELVKKHLQIYPYIVDFLRFAFWLAVENGDYDNASRILNRLKQAISTEDYQKNTSILESHVRLHNEIISREFDYDNLDDTGLSLHHLYILFLQAKDNKQTHILNKIKTIDDNLGRSLASSKILPSFRKATIIKRGILFITVIIGSLYTYHEYNKRIDQIKKMEIIQKEFYQREKDGLVREKQEKEFFALILRNQYKESVELLLTMESKDIFDELTSFIKEDICVGLFNNKEYETLLKVPFECTQKPDAFYLSHLRDKNNLNRLENLKIFIEEFPKSKSYTAPILEELVKSFLLLEDSTNASIYALKLENHIELYPEHKEYLNSTVESLLKER